MTPTDPQGAGETRVEWRNVYEDGVVGYFDFPTREEIERWNVAVGRGREPVAYECRRIETITTTTRHPLGGTEHG